MATISSTIIPTGVERTSAAHLVIDHRFDESPITVVWSTVPVPCTDWLLGDLGSQGPVHQPADQVPDIWNSNDGGFPIWHAATEVRCGTCGQMVGPWVLVRDGHLEGDELTEIAREVAELADEEREAQRSKLIADLTADAEDTIRRLADGTIERDEVPDLEAMSDPGVGLRGNEVVAWATLPDPDGGDDPEIVEVTRRLPTTSTSS